MKITEMILTAAVLIILGMITFPVMVINSLASKSQPKRSRPSIGGGY